MYVDNIYAYYLAKLFDFNTERNIPTLYSSMTLLLASVLLIIIAQIHKKLKNSYIKWAILSFLFLSADEVASIYERLNEPIRSLFNLTGFLYYSWVIPYAILIVVLIITYGRFLLELPRKVMTLFVFAGFLFVLGAIGFELLEGWNDSTYDNRWWLTAILYTCEEFLEMLGVVIFIYALLTYITTQFNGLKITITK